MERWHSYSTLASSSIETPSSPEVQPGKPTHLHLPESGLVIMAPGKAGGCLTPLQGFFYFFGCQEHLDIHKVLRGRGSSGHNMSVAYKQEQLISTLFTPASHSEFRLGPTAPLPLVQPVQGTAHRQYPRNKIPGAEMVRDDWEAYMCQMPFGQGNQTHPVVIKKDQQGS